MRENINRSVVDDFGKEWDKFDQSAVPLLEQKNSFIKYFSLFPWDLLPNNSEGFDLGCGSGRWAYFCAPKVGRLHCLDPSPLALNVAKEKLSNYENCVFHNAGVDEIPMTDNSMDFGYSLGVLHHIPDTLDGLKKCTIKLKKGAPFLVYIYYAFDNKPNWFKLIWQTTIPFRLFISILPFPLKYIICQLIALFIYFPLVKLSKTLEKFGMKVDNIPLSSYRNQGFYSLRTDALDRFGTKLEHRFTKNQITEMMLEAGLERIEFRVKDPYWCAIGYRCDQ
jgi:ubiquinone/menaquinone biosynthesis C-methylase UbiE